MKLKKYIEEQNLQTDSLDELKEKCILYLRKNNLVNG